MRALLSRHLAAAVAVVSALAITGTASAQEPVTVAIKQIIPTASYVDLITSIGGTLAVVIAAALGLAVGITLVSICWKFVRRFMK